MNTTQLALVMVSYRVVFVHVKTLGVTLGMKLDRMMVMQGGGSAVSVSKMVPYT